MMSSITEYDSSSQYILQSKEELDDWQEEIKYMVWTLEMEEAKKEPLIEFIRELNLEEWEQAELTDALEIKFGLNAESIFKVISVCVNSQKDIRPSKIDISVDLPHSDDHSTLSFNQEIPSDPVKDMETIIANLDIAQEDKEPLLQFMQEVDLQKWNHGDLIEYLQTQFDVAGESAIKIIDVCSPPKELSQKVTEDNTKLHKAADEKGTRLDEKANAHESSLSLQNLDQTSSDQALNEKSKTMFIEVAEDKGDSKQNAKDVESDDNSTSSSEEEEDSDDESMSWEWILIYFLCSLFAVVILGFGIKFMCCDIEADKVDLSSDSKGWSDLSQKVTEDNANLHKAADEKGKILDEKKREQAKQKCEEAEKEVNSKLNIEEEKRLSCDLSELDRSLLTFQTKCQDKQKILEIEQKVKKIKSNINEKRQKEIEELQKKIKDPTSISDRDDNFDKLEAIKELQNKMLNEEFERLKKYVIDDQVKVSEEKLQLFEAAIKIDSLAFTNEKQTSKFDEMVNQFKLNDHLEKDTSQKDKFNKQRIENVKHLKADWIESVKLGIIEFQEFKKETEDWKLDFKEELVSLSKSMANDAEEAIENLNLKVKKKCEKRYENSPSVFIHFKKIFEDHIKLEKEEFEKGIKMMVKKKLFEAGFTKISEKIVSQNKFSSDKKKLFSSEKLHAKMRDAHEPKKVLSEFPRDNVTEYVNEVQSFETNDETERSEFIDQAINKLLEDSHVQIKNAMDKATADILVNIKNYLRREFYQFLEKIFEKAAKDNGHANGKLYERKHVKPDKDAIEKYTREVIEFFKKDCNKSISEGYLFKYKLFFNAITDSLDKKNICEQMKTDYEEKMEEMLTDLVENRVDRLAHGYVIPTQYPCAGFYGDTFNCPCPSVMALFLTLLFCGSGVYFLVFSPTATQVFGWDAWRNKFVSIFLIIFGCCVFFMYFLFIYYLTQLRTKILKEFFESFE